MLDNFEVLDQRLADQLIDLVIKRASKRIRLVAASGAAPWERLRRRRAVRMIQL
jgi:hypothetical protein